MAENERYYFKLRFSYKGAFDSLSDSGAAALIRQMCHYAADGETATIPNEIAIIWPIVKDDLDRDRTDWENGKKGGRPRGDSSIKPDDEATIDEAAFKQAIKYGFSEEEAKEIGRFRNTPPYSQFVYQAMEACYNQSKQNIAYFRGVLKKKTNGY